MTDHSPLSDERIAELRQDIKDREGGARGGGFLQLYDEEIESMLDSNDHLKAEVESLQAERFDALWKANAEAASEHERAEKAESQRDALAAALLNIRDDPHAWTRERSKRAEEIARAALAALGEAP